MGVEATGDHGAGPEETAGTVATSESRAATAIAEKAAREEKAIKELTGRLVQAYTESYSAERVHSAVGAARRRFDGHTVRDFVPILVERIARRELDGSPEDPGTETVAAQQITEPSSASPADRLRAAARDLLPPPWTARKLVLPVAALIVIVVAVAVSIGGGGGGTPAPAAAAEQVLVHGIVGSEKMGFFDDPRVVDALARNGVRIQVEAAGSRQIATSVDLGKYDFAFPSSTPAAERILRQRNITTKYTPFSSPMAIATFAPIVDLLTRAGVVKPGPVPTFDMNRYLDLTQHGTQWDQLPGNTEYPVNKSLLIGTTDPRTSNSAAMYLAVAGYVANDNTIVRGQTAEDFVLGKVSRLFTKQGYTENSSEGPFAEYLQGGIGPAPLVWIYEAQFVEAGVQGKLKPDMQLLYPGPTVLSRHTVVPLTPAGDRVGRLLSTDPELQRLATEHGYRTDNSAEFTKVTTDHVIPAAHDVADVVDPPTYDTLEYLLDGVAKSYN
ncbi:three-helix bundle dimerization domain-containing protein [Nocardia sp. alder85J]|uniref:three-helix bundle dimerization domain-containing protein n=1 Tax=Nocardia sp. alder85J TaxID=2862949 RepID=UPI001CD429EE|nr:hypothetical protein [Nocardia sp. alder85J]MCX4094250.1 hypothetical protein [Nocardia sp. alder85J]